MRWVGAYRIEDDAFSVFRTAGSEHRLLTEFTPHEAVAVELAAEGRNEFIWSPKHSELTQNSRAYWAMM